MRCSASSAIARRKSSAPGAHTSGLSTLIKDHLAGAASRLAALLLPQILPVFLVVTPCQPGAALRDLVLVQRGQATSVKSPMQKCTNARMHQLYCIGALVHSRIEGPSMHHVQVFERSARIE